MEDFIIFISELKFSMWSNESNAKKAQMMKFIIDVLLILIILNVILFIKIANIKQFFFSTIRQYIFLVHLIPSILESYLLLFFIIIFYVYNDSILIFFALLISLSTKPFFIINLSLFASLPHQHVA